MSPSAWVTRCRPWRCSKFIVDFCISLCNTVRPSVLLKTQSINAADLVFVICHQMLADATQRAVFDCLQFVIAVNRSVNASPGAFPCNGVCVCARSWKPWFLGMTHGPRRKVVFSTSSNNGATRQIPYHVDSIVARKRCSMIVPDHLTIIGLAAAR